TTISASFKRLNVRDEEQASNELKKLVSQVPSSFPARLADDLESADDSWRMIDSVPVPIVMLTKTGEVDIANRRLLEYFGRSIEEVKRWGTNALVHPEDLPRLIELFQEAITSGTPYESEHRLRRSDGIYRWFQARAFPLRNAGGHVARWCVLLTDV